MATSITASFPNLSNSFKSVVPALDFIEWVCLRFRCERRSGRAVGWAAAGTETETETHREPTIGREGSAHGQRGAHDEIEGKRDDQTDTTGIAAQCNATSAAGCSRGCGRGRSGRSRGGMAEGGSTERQMQRVVILGGEAERRTLHG
jgi:hypothetical protein